MDTVELPDGSLATPIRVDADQGLATVTRDGHEATYPLKDIRTTEPEPAATIRERVFDAGVRCETCEYRIDTLERHPYGETTAAQHLRECGALRDEHCPGVHEARSRIEHDLESLLLDYVFDDDIVEAIRAVLRTRNNSIPARLLYDRLLAKAGE